MYSPLQDDIAPVTPQRAAVPGITSPSGNAGAPATPSTDVLGSLILAIQGRESGGNPNALSPQGARGKMQIMRGTFDQYAQPGESYDNEDHRVIAAVRKIADDYNFYGGDLMKTAAAYIGGRGAIAADGTIRTTRKDGTPLADALGTTPLAYAQSVIAKIGNTRTPAAQPPAAAAPAVDNGLSKDRGADIGVDAQGRVYANGQVFDSKDYGKAIELYRTGAFTSPGEGKLPQGFRAPKPGDVETYFQNIVPSSDSMKAIKSGVANYKAGWNEIVGAGYQMAGTPAASNPGIQAAEINKRYAEQMGATSSLPQTWDSAQGVGGVTQLAYGKFLESLPYMVEALSTGLVGAGARIAGTRGAVAAAQLAAKSAGEAALRSGAGEAAIQAAAQDAAKEVFKSTVPFTMRNAPEIAMVLGTMPSSAGDILGNQREQAGKYAPGTAAALSLPYAALNLLGAGPQAVKAIVGDTLHGAVTGMGGVGGRLARGATVGAWTGIEQGAQEAGQEVVNQAGRIAVDPTASMTSPDALARYKESAIVGTLIGVPGGAFAGVSARARAGKPVDLIKPTVTPPATERVASAAEQEVRAAVSSEPVSTNIAPTGNIDLRPEQTPFTGVRQPLATPDQAATLATPTGTIEPPVTARVPRAAPETAPSAPTGGVEAILSPGAQPAAQTNQLGESFTPGSAALPAANPQAGGATSLTTPLQDALVGSQPENAVTAPMRRSTTSVTRQRPRQYRTATTDQITGTAMPTTGVAAPEENTVTVKLPTRGEQLKARAAENAAGTVELTPGNKRPKGSKGATVATTLRARAAEKLAKKAAAQAQANPTVSDESEPRSGESSLRAGATGVNASTVHAEKVSEPARAADEEISDDEAKKISTLFAVSRKPRERVKEPSGREQKKASIDTVGTKRLHEEVQSEGELNSHLERIEKLNRSLRGPDDYLSKSKADLKKPVSERGRASTRGGIDRVASDSRERATRIEAVLDHFDSLVKKHGVAKVNAMFEFRKKYNFERNPALEDAADNRKQAEANIRLSNLWRLYRQGKFDTNAFGFTRGGSHAMGRSRVEEGSKPTTLASWFNGEHKMLHRGGGNIKGVKALAYYMRMYGRSDLEGLLGGRLYHIFNATDANVDFHVAEGDHFTMQDGRAVDGAFITASPAKPVSVNTENGVLTIKKPTILVTNKTATEEVVPHELLHAATWHVISTDTAARTQFMPIVEAVRSADKSKLSVTLQQTVAAVTQKNEAAAVAELVSYGFTNPEFQDFLKIIEMSPPKGGRIGAVIDNAFQFFVNLVKLVTGAHGAKYTALSRFIEEGARLLDKAEKAKPAKAKPIVLGANSLFKAAAFKHKSTGEILETGPTHRVSQLTGDQTAWTDGFVDHQGKFYTREEAAARAGMEEVGQLHTGDLEVALGHSVPVAERVAFGNILNPVTAIERTYKTLIKYTLPFLHAEVGEKSTFEKYVESNAAKLANHIIENHPLVARVASGVIDKFGVPEKWQAIVDMGRKKVHNADQISFGWWENMRGFSDEQQKLVHDYIKADGKIDTSKFDEKQKLFLANLNLTLKNIVERAAEQGTLPEGLKSANPTELVRWINKDTARLAFGLKTSGNYTNWPKGYTASAYNAMVLGKAEGYHRAVADMPDANPAAPDYVYVPVGADLKAESEKLGYPIKELDASRVWRVLNDKGTTKTMWSGIPYAEGRKMMKATNFTDALVVTMHNLMHDTAANEWANSAVTGSALDTKDSLVYTSREALENDVEKSRILDDINHPKRQLLARTPGYWVLLGNGYGELSGKYVPATVYSIITDVRDKSPIFPEYRTVINFWKKTKTAWSPATHFNNVASSFVMAYMNDIPVTTIAKAFSTFLNRDGIGKDAWEQFTYSGALVSSFSAGEVGTSIARKIDAVIAKEHHAESAVGLVRLMHAIEQTKAVELAGKAADAAVEWYQHEDNIFRLAAFMEGQRRGMDTETAGKFAADSMINYSIDARYINNLRKTVMPFLAWPYRMVPMMVRTAIFKPWKLATMITILHGLNALSYAISGGDEDEERKKLPEYMRGSMFLMPGAPQALRLPGSIDGKPLYWNVSNFMPLGNFAEESRSGLFGIQGWPQGLMPSGPLITAAELLLNHDSFTDKPIYSPTESGPEKFGDTAKAAWTAFTPNIPLPFNRQGDKIYDLLRSKHGVTGDEMSWGPAILSMVGPKLVPLDERERGAQAGIAIAAIVHEYRSAIHKMARDEVRYENPDFEKIHEKQAALIARMLTKIKKAKGEE